MITLVGNKDKDSFKVIQDKLDELTVAYQMMYTKDTPYLQDGNTLIKGKDEINAYLEELQSELIQWYYCAC